MREIYFLVIFFFGKALLSPSFEEFSYFFLMNVIGISKFTFALLVLLGNVCSIIGSLLYKAFFRKVATRTMILWAMIIGTVGMFLSFMLAKRWNLEIGIPDLAFLIFTDIVFSVISVITYSLPIMAFFAKVTPKKVEGTIFAFLTGTMNFCSTVVSPGMGTWINHQFVGVNKKDQSNYSNLILIGLIMHLFVFPLLLLIPTKKQVKKWNIKRKAEADVRYEERKKRRGEREEEEQALFDKKEG
jgi:Na+/melibiose symporter-like transporter